MQFKTLESSDPRIKIFLDQHSAEIQQYPAWGAVQQTLNVGVRHLGLIENEELKAYVQVFSRRLPGGYKWWLIPRGPIATNPEIAGEFFVQICANADNQNVVYVEVAPPKEFPISKHQFPINRLEKSSFPETTLVLDLTKSEEELLKEMHTKGRYNIRVAEKNGVTVREASDLKGVTVFYQLLQSTTARDGFRGHGKTYYEQLLQILTAQGMAKIFLAEKSGKPLAAIIATYAGQTATYYYGASDHKERALMAPYACQWAAIRDAKLHGFTCYDFLGIAPEGAIDHELAGVTDFKRKFGGQTVNYQKTFDIVLKPLEYRFFNLLRKIKSLIKN